MSHTTTMRLPFLIPVLLYMLHGARCHTLQFREDGSFTLVVFSDLHYGEGFDLDTKNDALQRAVLDAERPDLIVYLGDLVSGWKGGSNGWMEGTMKRILAYPNSQGYSHAILLGNHDDEADLSRREILNMDILLSGQLSFTQSGPLDITGASNYHLDVFSSTGDGSAASRLWFFDSMNRGCEGNGASWGCVGKNTVEWMDVTSRGLTRVDQSVAFVHIPIPEHRLAWGDARAVGVRQEDSACPVVNTGLAKQLLKSNVSMVVSGHDHQNDFLGNIYLSVEAIQTQLDNQSYTGDFQPGAGSPQYGDVPMMMAYSRKSGYGSYGPGNISRGARVIRLWDDQAPGSIQKQSRMASGIYPFLSWGYPPQYLHDGPIRLMETWITNAEGTREVQKRPYQKYEIQPECYNAAPGSPGVFWIGLSVLVYSAHFIMHAY